MGLGDYLSSVPQGFQLPDAVDRLSIVKPFDVEIFRDVFDKSCKTCPANSELLEVHIAPDNVIRYAVNCALQAALSRGSNRSAASYD